MSEHLLHELQQIQLIQKKLIQKFENAQDVDNPDRIGIIGDLDRLSNFTASITKTLSTKKVEHELLTELNHKLRTPLVPIRAYANMLLSEKFGKLSEEQANRLRVMNSNIEQLEEVIVDLLDKKKFDVIENNEENQTNAKRTIKELKQEKIILGKIIQNEEKKNMQLSRKHVLTIAGSIAVIGTVIMAYSLFVVELVGQQYRVPITASTKDSYVIQNLKGDTIDTWLSWRLVDGAVLHINVVDAGTYPEKLDLIKEVVSSKQAIEVDDSLLQKGPKGSTSTYYVGWSGALAKAAEHPTKFYIPNKLDVISSPTGIGEIIIKLTNERSGDGYSGSTKSISQDIQNQILKSEITIYEVDKLSNEGFKAILRHELGHALGLAHSTATEDLMAPVIQTEYPYISDCDIDAIKALYDGNKRSEVVCQK